MRASALAPRRRDAAVPGAGQTACARDMLGAAARRAPVAGCVRVRRARVASPRLGDIAAAVPDEGLAPRCSVASGLVWSATTARYRVTSSYGRQVVGDGD